MYLIKEYFSLSNDYQEEGGTIKLKGTIQRADAINGNNRIYPKRLLEREMENYQKLIREKRSLGELDHSDSEEVKLCDASHMITKAKWNGNDIVGEMTVLNTPKGKILQELVKSGVNIGISSRGLGSLREQNGSLIVEDNFKLVCFDIVSDPSTTGAFLKPINESVQRRIFSKEDRLNRLINEILR